MPSVSLSQQRAMGMAYATRTGKMSAGNLRGAAKRIYESNMSTEAIRDYAKTKTYKLPRKIKEAAIGKVMLSLGKKVIKNPLKVGFGALYASSLKKPFEKSLKSIARKPLKKL